MRRKFLLLFLLLSFISFNSAFASTIDILPTMRSKSNVQDKVWVGAFQLVWNDFMNKIAFNTIHFPDGTPQSVRELNKQEFTEDDISPKYCYKYIGKIKKNTAKIITKSIKRKFNETSDIINKFDLTPSDDRFLIYTMMKKDFKFPCEFDKLGKDSFRGKYTEFFGLTNESTNEQRAMVNVLFYNNPQDFAISVKTKGVDEIYLYKTNNTNTFNCLYSDMNKKQANYRGETYLTADDVVKIPNLSFFEEKSFDELSNKRVKGTNIIIQQAIESVRFDLDNQGVKLKSEAGLSFATTSLRPESSKKFLIFNDTFIIFVKEKGKTNPYFALRVHNIENFQK